MFFQVNWVILLLRNLLHLCVSAWSRLQILINAGKYFESEFFFILRFWTFILLRTFVSEHLKLWYKPMKLQSDSRASALIVVSTGHNLWRLLSWFDWIDDDHLGFKLLNCMKRYVIEVADSLGTPGPLLLTVLLHPCTIFQEDLVRLQLILHIGLRTSAMVSFQASSRPSDQFGLLTQSWEPHSDIFLN